MNRHVITFSGGGNKYSGAENSEGKLVDCKNSMKNMPGKKALTIVTFKKSKRHDRQLVQYLTQPSGQRVLYASDSSL